MGQSCGSGSPMVSGTLGTFVQLLLVLRLGSSRLASKCEFSARQGHAPIIVLQLVGSLDAIQARGKKFISLAEML